MKEQERILALMDSQQLNAKDFAVEVGISAATMSNIINGRNKPSLEVMQKILNRFRNVSTVWLILGVGSMFNETSNSQTDISGNHSLLSPDNELAEYDNSNSNHKSHSYTKTSINQNRFLTTIKKVTKVVVFYNDGTFDELKNDIK